MAKVEIFGIINPAPITQFSDNIKTSISVENVEREMNWSYRRPDGTRHHPDKPEKEIIFEKEMALAVLLMNEAVFINNHWWEKDWPEAAQKTFSVNVNTNDLFAWGCADAEEITVDELETVYQYWKIDPSWGTAIWAMIKHREMPQYPVEKRIREGNIWDLDVIKEKYQLRANQYDGFNQITSKNKYATYVAWMQEQGRIPLEYNLQWWDGWSEYIKYNPDWYQKIGKFQEKELIAKFKQENGYIEP